LEALIDATASPQRKKPEMSNFRRELQKQVFWLPEKADLDLEWTVRLRRKIPGNNNHELGRLAEPESLDPDKSALNTEGDTSKKGRVLVSGPDTCAGELSVYADQGFLWTM